MTSPEIPNVPPANVEAQQGLLHRGVHRVRELVGRVGLAIALSAGGAGAYVAAEVGHAEPVAAETGGYPDADAADCSASYGDYSWCKGGTDISPRGYGYRNCTDYVAWRVQNMIGRNIRGLKNAKDWDDNAGSLGFSWDYTPEPGDAAVSEYGKYGHVMFVEGVNSDGSIVVSDYNQAGTGAYRGPRTIAKAGLKFVDFNGPGVGLNPSNLPYAAVSEGQEFYSTEGMVYTKAGGTAYYIKPKNTWNSGDTFNWGGEPVGPVPAEEAKDHELGYGNPTAHPPRDYTAVYRQNDPQQYIFVGGNAYPIGAGEIDDLGVRDRAFMIPPDGRIYNFLNRPLNLPNGSLFRYAGMPRVNQLIENPDQPASAYYVNNQTVLECLRKVNRADYKILPQSARPFLEGLNGTQELSQQSACTFPTSTVVLKPGSPDAWRIVGDNVTTPYQKRYYPSSLNLYLNTGGTPHNISVIPQALDDIPRGANMGAPDGIYFGNQANGDVFKIENGVFRKVPSTETYGCLGNPPFIRIPGEAVGNITQGIPMSCEFENRQVMEPNGTIWYIKDGQRHYVQNMNIVYGLAGRAGTGMPVPVSSETASHYSRSTIDAFVPYPVTVFAYNPVDGKVWKVNTDGTRQHAGSMCVSDFMTTSLKPWRAIQFPAGEYNGHKDVGTWSANPQDCRNIYDEWHAKGMA